MTDAPVEDIAAALPRMRDRWLGGGDAANVAPAGWAGDATRLLVLAGQALEVLCAPQPAGELSLRPLLPKLALPSLVDDRRSLLRRTLTVTKAEPTMQLAVIRLLASRGFTAHPEDWRPSLTQLQAIDIYTPWAAWREGAAPRVHQQTVSAETWTDWSWSERRNAFQALRNAKPSIARELLERVFVSEPADKRVVLLTAMGPELSADDAPFLESLENDRSDNVKKLARQLLSRLGRFATPGEVETELADFIEVQKKGLLRRSTSVFLKAFKTPAQGQRASALLGQTSLPALAAKLSLPEEELADAWAPANNIFDLGFLNLVAQTGSASAVERLVARLEKDFPFGAGMVMAFADSLPPPLAARVAAACMAHHADPTFISAVTISSRNAPGWLSRSAIDASPGWRVLLEHVGAEAEKQAPAIDRGLLALGILCSAETACYVIDRMTAFGRSPADPALTLLALNAALPERPA